MPRTWKMLGLTSLFALALAAPAARADTDGINPDQDKLKAIQDSLKSMDEGLKKAFADLKKDMDAQQEELKHLKAAYADATLKAAGALLQAAELKKQVGQLRAEMDALRKRLPSDGGTIALYPPADKAILDDILKRLTAIEQKLSQMPTTALRPAFPPATATGRVLLVNRSAEELLFVVNGRTYRIPAGASAALDGVGAGNFTYEVISPTWGLIRPLQTRTLAPQETFTITAQ